MIKLIKPRKPIQQYSAVCHHCQAEFTFDKSDTRTINDEGQRRCFDVVSCPECEKDVSQWCWKELTK